MQDQNAQLLAQLRDIKGFDPFPWWPLPPGWWFLLSALIFLCIAVWAAQKALADRRNKTAWKAEALQLLKQLEEDRQKSAREKIASLSILLRKLAMRRHGRKQCAGLEGRDWLKWLTLNDPIGFDWEREGRLMIEAPYAPESQGGQSAALERIINAVKGWIR